MQKIFSLLLLSLFLSGCVSGLIQPVSRVIHAGEISPGFDAPPPTITPAVKVATLVVATPAPQTPESSFPTTPTSRSYQLPKTLDEIGIPPATYTDSFAGLALDYPSGWIVTDLSNEAKQDAAVYTVSFRSAQPQTTFKSQEVVDPTISSIDLTIFLRDSKTLQQAIEERRDQDQQSATGQPIRIQLEEDWTLRSGLQAHRFLLNLGNSGEGTRDQLVSELVTVLNGKMVLLTGRGDLGLFNVIAVSLRETR